MELPVRGTGKLTREHRIDQLESRINLLTHFGAGQNDLATNENQEHNLGLHHAVDQTREEFRLVGAEMVVTRGQTLQTDGELDIAGADDVLDLEVRELGVETKLLDDTRVFSGSQLGIILRFGTSHNHLARSKDKGGSLRFPNTHDDGRETLRKRKETSSATLYPDRKGSGRCGR